MKGAERQSRFGQRRLSLEAILAAGLVCVVAGFALPHVDAPYSFVDSRAYVEWPSDFILMGLYVMGARPPAYPAFLAIFGTGYALIVAQTLLSIACWSVFGWVVGRLPGVLLAMLAALAPSVWRWNSCLLSESFSLSMTVLALGLAALLTQKAATSRSIGWKSLLCFCVSVFAFAWSRDANLVVAPILMLPALFCRGAPRLTIVLAVLLAMGVGAIDSRMNHRSQWSLYNAVTGRVMRDKEGTEVFRKAGLTISKPLRKAAGGTGSHVHAALHKKSPEFFEWTREHGARTYWTWILSQPKSYATAWDMIDKYYAADSDHYTPRLQLPVVVQAAKTLSSVAGAAVSILLLLLVVALQIRRGSHVRESAILALFACGAGLVSAFLAYHADAAEVQRHMQPALVLIRTALVIGVAGLIDSVRRNRVTAVAA